MKTCPSFAVGDLVRAYLNSKRMVLAAGFGEEILWQKMLSLDSLTESTLLRETAWVILSAGMREAVVRRKFPDISRAFFLWNSAQVISSRAKYCFNTALKSFNHPGKIAAIVDVARRINSVGFRNIKSEIVAAPLDTLRQFPFIGRVTVFHLAKNLGVNVAKPDRHLTRLAWASGYTDVQDFCHVIAGQTGDTVPEVDIVLWRFATLLEDYLAEFLSTAAERSYTTVVPAFGNSARELKGLTRQVGGDGGIRRQPGEKPDVPANQGL